MESETTRQEIMLPINAEGMFKKTKFYVVDDDMNYNVLFGRPRIHDMKIVPSTVFVTEIFNPKRNQTNQGRATNNKMFTMDETTSEEAIRKKLNNNYKNNSLLQKISLKVKNRGMKRLQK